MDFNDDIGQVSRFSLKKLFRLIRFKWKLSKALSSKRHQCLYYPPPPPRFVPIIRDILIFVGLRAKKNNRWVYHVHAGGLPEYLEGHPLLKKCYLKIDPAPYHVVELSSDGVSFKELFPKAKHTIIPYGLEIKRDESLQKNPATKKQILFIGNIYEDKGIDLTIRAVSEIHKKGGKISLNIVGGGSQEDVTRVTSLINELQASDYVKYLGILYGDAKWEVFNQAHYMCFPSYYENEKLPLVLIESLGLGIPCISSHWRGIPEIIPEEVGVLVQPNDLEDLVKGIESIFKRDYQDLAANALKRFEERFSLGCYLTNFEKVFYDSIESD